LDILIRTIASIQEKTKKIWKFKWKSILNDLFKKEVLESGFFSDFFCFVRNRSRDLYCFLLRNWIKSILLFKFIHSQKFDFKNNHLILIANIQILGWKAGSYLILWFLFAFLFALFPKSCKSILLYWLIELSIFYYLICLIKITY